jgi:hypothetical protein
MLADTFRELAGIELVDEDGNEQVLELLPPATPDEIERFAAELPAPLPDEIREALGVTRGFANGPIESLSLVDLGEFGMEDVFPHAHALGHDGFGNYWVVDLVPERADWGPVFYACHDPPVIAYQSETVEVFVREVVAMERPGPRSPVDLVHEEVVMRLWDSDPGMTSQPDAAASDDTVLASFASGLDSTARIVDLRSPGLGDGFAWGRYGPRTTWTRCGPERIWAVVPPSRRSLFARIFGR